MKLEMIIGPAGSGKTHYILDDITKTRKDSNVIVLTADQNSYNFEKMLCEKFQGTFNIDVMNFTTLTKKLYKMLTGTNENILSEQLKMFYFYKAAINLKDSNNFLVKRILQDTNFIEVVEELVNELKQYNVDLESLEDYVEQTEVNKEKIEAVLEIYTEYVRLLKEDSTFDKNDYLQQLLFYIDYVDLSNYVFYIDAYYNFTGIEYYFISKLVKKSKKVAIAVIGDANKYFNFKLEQLVEGYELKNLSYNAILPLDLYNNDSYKLDIFRKSHEIVANINTIIVEETNIDFSVIALDFFKDGSYLINFNIKNNKVENYKVEEHINSRFQNVANKHIASNYYKAFKSTIDADSSIQLIKANDKQQEIRQVAREIYRLQKKDKLRGQDIAILYRDSVYENYSYIFEDYGLNVHIDKDKDVSNHRLLKLLREVINFNEDTFRQSIVNILKTRLVNFEAKYRQRATAKVLLDNSTLTSAKLKKEIKDRNIDILNGFKNYDNSSKLLTKDKSDINVLSIEQVEHMLELLLVNTPSDLENVNYKIEGFTNEQAAICCEVLLELYGKISAIANKKQVKVETVVKKIDALFKYCDIKMLLDKEDGDYDDIEQLKIDSIDRQVYKKTLVILDDVAKKFGDNKFNYEHFSTLLLLSLNSIKYRSIPELDDFIVMSAMDLAKVENRKVVFVIGFNEDVLPMKKNEGLIDDNDKENFALKNIFLSPTTKMSLIDEEFVAYIALTRATDKTYISYSCIDKAYKESFPSPYLATVKNILKNISIKTVDKILRYDSSDYEFYFNNSKEIYTRKEFNYLFIKFYRRLKEIEGSGSKEEKQLFDLLNAMLDYDFNMATSRVISSDYEVEEILSDKIFLERRTLTNDYLPTIFSNYKFSLSENSIADFLTNKGERFANFSASKLDDFQKNPYLFFVKRVLGIYEKRAMDIDALTIGNFFHAVMAERKITTFIEKKAKKIQMLDVEDMESSVNKIDVSKILYDTIYSSEHKDILHMLKLVDVAETRNYIFRNLLERLKLAIKIEIYYSALSDFVPKYVEKNFNITLSGENITYEKDGEIVSKKLATKYEGVPTIKLRGTIDRIDFNSDAKKYSVIDYKSSKTDIDFSAIASGEVSQLLTYVLAMELMLGVSSEDIFGLFYREVARKHKEKINPYRLRGLVNTDILLNEVLLSEQVRLNTKELMYFRLTNKGKIHGSDKKRAFTTPELENLITKNLENIFELLKKIYSFDLNYDNYEVEDEKAVELETLYKYSLGNDTRLEVKKKEK